MEFPRVGADIFLEVQVDEDMMHLKIATQASERQ